MTARGTVGGGWEKAHHWFSREAVPALRLTAPQIAVYNALRDRADARGWCHPSQDTIARESGLGVRAVRLALTRLVDVGLVEVQGGTRQGNRYRIGMKPTFDASRIAAPDAAINEGSTAQPDDRADSIAAPDADDCGTSCRSIAALDAYEEDPWKNTHEEHPIRNSDFAVAGERPLTAKQQALVTDAIGAIFDDLDLPYMRVGELTARELDLLDTLHADERRPRIRDWCGLAARWPDGYALRDDADPRLDALLAAHSIDLAEYEAEAFA